MNNTQSPKIEITNIHYDNHTIRATISSEVSPSCMVYDDIYIGNNKQLYISGRHDREYGHSVMHTIQAATFYVVHEKYIVDMVLRAIKNT